MKPDSTLANALAGRRGSIDLGWTERERVEARNSLIAGIVLTLIVWPAFVLGLGYAVSHLGHSDLTLTAVNSQTDSAAQRTFDIQIAPETFALPEKKPLPDRFVETNPDAPENVPDETRNTGAQNQQVAQEKPTPDGKSDRPATEGKTDIESTQIVDGRLMEKTEQPPPTPAFVPEVQEALAAEQARRDQTPLPGEEKLEGDNPNGFGLNVSKVLENITKSEQRVEGQKDAPLLAGALDRTQIKIDRNRPQPRPIIAQNVRPAILAENKFGTKNIGPVAYDARWSNYAQYLQRLIDSVQIQWEKLIEQSRVYPPNGSKVTVKFRLESTEGLIAEILHVEGTAGQQAERACISAITDRAPYGKWTEDMLAVLGESQELTFTFYYGY